MEYENSNKPITPPPMQIGMENPYHYGPNHMYTQGQHMMYPQSCVMPQAVFSAYKPVGPVGNGIVKTYDEILVLFILLVIIIRAFV